MKKKYLLTLQFTFGAPDDPMARTWALALVSAIKRRVGGAIAGAQITFKLQEISDNKPPRRVRV